MSTPATAATRLAEKDATGGGKQLHVMATVGGAAVSEPATDAASVVTSDAARVERLISQLEARSMALVPYGLGALREMPPPPKPNSSAMIAAGLVAVWISTMAFGIAYIRYSNRLSDVQERTSAKPLVIPTVSDAQDQQVARSVDHLAKALVSSSERLNQLQAEMDRSNKDWQKLAGKISDNSRRKSEPTVAKVPPPAPLPAAAPLLTINPAAAVPGTPLPKNWHQVIDIKPSDAAVPHQSAEGAIDYWLVPPRSGDRSQLSKVLPIGRSAEGVVIHNLEDGKDYTLTPSGEWKNGGLAESGK